MKGIEKSEKCIEEGGKFRKWGGRNSKQEMMEGENGVEKKSEREYETNIKRKVLRIRDSGR